MNTEKKYNIIIWIPIIFVIALAIISRVSGIPTEISKIVPVKILVPITIYFVIYSVVLSLYCYYWGKYNGERKEFFEKINKL